MSKTIKTPLRNLQRPLRLLGWRSGEVCPPNGHGGQGGDDEDDEDEEDEEDEESEESEKSEKKLIC